MLNYETLNSVLQSFVPELNLEASDVEAISKYLVPTQINKGGFLCEKGKMCNKLGILISGLLYAYFEHEEKEKNVVSRFFYVERNPIVTNYESFREKTKSNETIEALEDSFLLTITNENLNKLYKKIPNLNILGRYFTENSYLQSLNRNHQLQSMKAESRLKMFEKEHKPILGKVQQQHIASYLGISAKRLRELHNLKK